MGNAIANLLGGAASTYSPSDLDGMTEAERLAWYKKMNLTPPVAKPSPLSRAVKWIGEKLGTPAAPAAPATAANPGDTVSLIDRLKAGNIDQVGSEAYNRWGQGKADGDAAELARESRRSTPADAQPPVAEATDLDANRHFTTKEWAEAPEYQQSNPAWDGLPGDEFAIKEGA